jgi:hypothetical protein
MSRWALGRPAGLAGSDGRLGRLAGSCRRIGREKPSSGPSSPPAWAPRRSFAWLSRDRLRRIDLRTDEEERLRSRRRTSPSSATTGASPHLRQDRRRRRVRPHVRAGRRRLQPRRDQLPQRDGPPGRGRGRGGDLARPAHEALHRPRGDEGAVPKEPGLAEGADGRVGRRPQLLPAHAPGGDAARDQRFEPWMALSFSEGSIGGDIERVNLRSSRRSTAARPRGRTPGAAAGRQARSLPASSTPSRPARTASPIAPANTASGKALLLINPHTSFFFREPRRRW